MVEEVQNPQRIFPRMMLTGLGLAALIYVLVSISVIAVIPEGEIERVVSARAGSCSRWSRRGPRRSDRHDLPVPDRLPSPTPH